MIPPPPEDISPDMTGSRLDNRAAILRIVQLALVIATCAGLLVSSRTMAAPGTDQQSHSVAQQSSLPDRAPANGVRIVDLAGILTPQQFQDLNAVLDRLARLGTESIVLLRDSSDASTSQSYLADDLRVGWSVESSAGARDGLVIMISIDRTDPSQSGIITSSGLHTFPIRHLSESGFGQLVEKVALPQVQAGDVFGGINDLAEMTLGTVIDSTGTLTERQISTLDGDIRRLNELGLPMLVYMRSADESVSNDQAFAEEVLAVWETEFGEGPRNQVVVLVTVDEATPSNSTITYASGEDAFPIRQLTAEGYRAILSDEASPPLQDGNTYLSLAYAVRKAINFAEYSPPSPEPLSEVQSWFQQPLNILAAVLVQTALALYVLIPAMLERRLTLVPSPRAMTVYVIATSTMAVVVGALGVLDRNRASALAGLGVFLLATVIFPLVRAGLLKLGDYSASRREHHRSTTEDVVHAN